jgi:hypothetical protein
VWGTSQVSTRYAADSVIPMVYRASANAWFVSDFDSNSNNLTPQCENGATGYGAPYKNQICKVYKCTEENSQELPTYLVSRVDGYSKRMDEANGDVKVGAIYEY